MPFATSILVCTDLSPASHAALDEAARIARECRAKVTVLYVFEAGPWTLPPSVANPENTMRRIVEEATGAAQSVLLALRERFFPGDPNVMLRTVEHSSAAQAVCSCARDWAADLIVIASHGRSGPSSAGGIGGVTEKVVRGAGCRVLVVPSQNPQDLAH